jgi:phosphate transport system substrate-binding protein
VELRNPKGETLWSYLATPGAASDDVSKELSKRIAKHVAEALAQVAVPSRTAPVPQPTTLLKGAGATFPYPVYAKWITNYRRENPAVEIAYDAVGSEAGVRRLLAGGADLGASDSPEAIREIAPGEESSYLLFPSVVGAVVPIVNLPGFPSDIAFTPEALAGIYLGQIKKWNDPVLKQANPHLHLPDLDIVVVHRADGSGTSYAWTEYLSKTSSQWQAQVGASMTPRWPIGRAANGNDGVAKLVKELSGSIGYVEFVYALENHLSFGKVRNRNGEFVGASLESIALAAKRGAEIGDDFKVSIVDSPDAGAYPIASFTWFVVPAHIADDAKRNAIAGFLKWALGPGQRQAAALGYLALPRDLVTKEEEAIARIR